jgi:ubiquinone/menaquinone biosynthesis C-methylase UbiE
VVPISTHVPLVAGPRDRVCRGWTLDNWVRRRWAPARAEVDSLSIQPGQRVSDLGAGVGYLTEAILERVGSGGIVDLVEPDPRSLMVARTRWASDPRIRLSQSSAASVPTIADETVDRVVLSLVLCCLRDKAGALTEAWRILRYGGLVLVSYPERPWALQLRKTSLRVSPTVWSRLVVQQPWRILSSERRGLIRRHLLRKPSAGPARDGARSEVVPGAEPITE